jgi:hypothetical protein
MDLANIDKSIAVDAGILDSKLSNLSWITPGQFFKEPLNEINLIKEQIPEIVTIQVPLKTYLYPSLLLNSIYKYFDLDSTSEDLNKTKI